MWVGWLEFDLLLGDVHSLTEKRSVIRPIIAELRRRFAVSAAETGAHELHRRYRQQQQPAPARIPRREPARLPAQHEP